MEKLSLRGVISVTQVLTEIKWQSQEFEPSSISLQNVFLSTACSCSLHLVLISPLPLCLRAEWTKIQWLNHWSVLHAQIPYWQSTASCRLAHISNWITSNTSSSAFPKCWNHLLILPQPQKNSTYFGILFLFSFVFNGRDLFSIARIRSVRSCLSHWIDTQTSPRVSPSSLLMLWLWLPLSSPLPFSISISHVLAFPLPTLHFQSYPFQINL